MLSRPVLTSLIGALSAAPALGQTTLNVSHRAADAHFILQDGVNNINSGELHETNMPGVFNPIAVTADPGTFSSLVSFMGPGLARADSLVDAATIQTGQGTVSAFAQTGFDYGFTIDASMPYSLEIEYEGVAPDSGESFSLVFAAVGGGELLRLSSGDFGPNSGPPTVLNASIGGSLPPGDYLMNVVSQPSHHAAGSGVFEFFPMRYSLTLEVGLPGDLNGDCIVDTADLGALLSAFGGSGVTGDLNGDGVIDTADLGALLTRFGVICP
ncbi:MAG: hypothetical protein H6814_04500 [Phycisphaeraceae bacterium]|nr:hypothetical protein [Phycisphaeraceae bacterium]